MLSGGAVVGDDWIKYLGTGYADFQGGPGSNATIEWQIERDATAEVDLAVRYNNHSSGDQPLRLVVNGETLRTVVFGRTGSRKRWRIEVIDDVSLKAGANSVQLIAPDGVGPTIDRLTVPTETVRQVALHSAIQIVHRPATASRPARSGPVIVVAGRAWAVNPDADTVTAVDTATLARALERRVGRTPRTLAQAPDGTIWVVNEGSHDISVLDSSDGAVVDTIELPSASMPYGLAFAPDGSAAYVTLQALGRLLRLDPARRSVVHSLALGPDADGIVPRPRGIAIDADGRRVLVARFVSPDRGGEIFDVEVLGETAYRVRTMALAIDPGPDTPESGRGLPNYIGAPAISPDGTQARVPSKKDNIGRGGARDGRALTHESTVRAAVSQIELANGRENLARRIDLDDRDMASAAVFSHLGDLLFVAVQGSNAVVAIDAHSGVEVAGMACGLAPQGLALDDRGRLYVQNFMGRSLSVFDVSGLLAGTESTARLLAEIGLVAHETLSDEVLRGKRIFYDASSSLMSLESYISCASCHLGGGHDGRTWDFTDRGEGLRNTISLHGRAGTGHGPLHWTGNFDEIQDFENDIRSHFGGSGFMSDIDFGTGTRADPLGAPKAGLSGDLDALAAYVSSLSAVPPSPYRNAAGGLTAEGRLGKAVFAREGCGNCHGGTEFTDSALGVLHDVGTAGADSGRRIGRPLTGLDTPTLKGVWATAPYLHDGSAPTLARAIEAHRGVSLSSGDLGALAAYVGQIDERPVTETANYAKDVDADPENRQPRGLWGDGDTVWVADYFDSKLYAYSLADGSRAASRDIDTTDEVADGAELPTGVWGDGETVWVADSDADRVYAYSLEDGTRDAAQDLALEMDGLRPSGLWGDGETLWVLDKEGRKVHAYAMSDAARAPERDFPLSAGTFNWGLWSDGDVFWTVDFVDKTAYAYRGGSRLASADMALDGNRTPSGLWSDGTTLWVSEYMTGGLRAYALPSPPTNAAESGPGDGGSADATLKSLALSGVDIGTFAAGTTNYSASVGNAIASTQVTATANHTDASVTIADRDGDTDGTSRNVSLAEGRNTITVTVTAEDAVATGTYTVTVTREAAPLRAWFSSPPAAHDGSSTFKVGLNFSADISTGFKVLRDDALSASGGTIRKAKRVDGRNDLWDIHVQPSGDAAVTLTLDPTTDVCGATGAVCTADGRALSNTPSVTVHGPTSDATLSALTLSGVDIGTFAAGTTSYSASVGNAVASTQVTATANDAGASVTIADDDGSTDGTSRNVSLDEGANGITVTVTAEDGVTTETYTVTVTRDEPGLTARFENVPDGHDGSSSFDLRVGFSEELAEGSGRTVASALSISGATRGYVVRVGKRRDLFKFALTPSGNGDVTVSLSAASGCDASNSVCTADGRALSNAPSVTVTGPAAVGASANGPVVTLTWSTARDDFGSPSGTDYGVRVNGRPRGVVSAALSGNTGWLMLEAPVAAGDTVTVAYLGSAMHPLAAATGQRSEPWDGLEATDLTGIEPPVARAASVHWRSGDPLAAVDDTVRLDASGLGLYDVGRCPAHRARAARPVRQRDLRPVATGGAREPARSRPVGQSGNGRVAPGRTP